MRNRSESNANEPAHHRAVTPAPSRAGNRRSSSSCEARSGHCILLSDGRILTMNEAKQHYLKNYWAN